ncbi:glutathione S-transferase family protein [Dyella sp.]|uniref:glutathione S-transferase family protein n=1 Tax=Dyella sp. TaxID=1869338 RepID=UPI002D7836D9|nr:glutathione S-transferase family protein [Dyella sp.]HET6433420.1 glutathione S-transferase family protein [Dyella sp.]
MLTLFDYLPSQNAWKVRQLLAHLHRPYRTVLVSIFEGEGQRDAFLRISPGGTVPAIALDDGRTLAESNAILMYLADGTPYLPDDAFGRARVWQWLSFEQERVESVIGALRHWTLTGKLTRRPPALVALKQAAARRTLAVLERELAQRPFLAGARYTIADISVFAYASRAAEAGFPLHDHPQLRAWVERVQGQPDHLAEHFDYHVDPHSGGDLP